MARIDKDALERIVTIPAGLAASALSESRKMKPKSSRKNAERRRSDR